jgi:hypothetical protein
LFRFFSAIAVSPFCERQYNRCFQCFFNLGQGTLNWDFSEVYPHFLSLLFYPSIS